jgi:hypothetical protein
VGTSLTRDEARRIAAKERSSSVKNRKREICTSGSVIAKLLELIRQRRAQALKLVERHFPPGLGFAEETDACDAVVATKAVAAKQQITDLGDMALLLMTRRSC